MEAHFYQNYSHQNSINKMFCHGLHKRKYIACVAAVVAVAIAVDVVLLLDGCSSWRCGCCAIPMWLLVARRPLATARTARDGDGARAATADDECHEDVACSEAPERVQVQRALAVVLAAGVAPLVVVMDAVHPHGPSTNNAVV
jgi:hypothetical protein